MNKKSQLTMLILLGLVLFVLVSLALYLSKTTLNKKEKISQAQENNLQIQPIKEYLQLCLDNAANDALHLIGQQGGYIYSSQGGNLVDFSNNDEGVMFTKNGQYKVAYSIFPPRSNQGTYFFETPAYPWETFPYLTADSPAESFKGFFGIGKMPPLTNSQGQASIQGQIENYVENSVSKCSLEKFSGQGYTILAEKPEAVAIIGDRDLSVKLTFPIHISGASQQTFELEDFATKANVRLRHVYFFAKNIVDSDTTDISFDAGGNSNNKDGIIVNVLRNNFNMDDLVIVTDTKSLVKGKPYQYIFSRKNRAPALYYIGDNERHFSANHEITEADISGDIQLRMGKDPDEDHLNYAIKIFGQPAEFPVTLDMDEIDFIIEVSDGQWSDFQIIKVSRVGT